MGEVCEKAKAGDVMPDGTVYAGISPDTGRPIYAALADAPLAMNWRHAVEGEKYNINRWYPISLSASGSYEGHGHKDWRMPNREELKVLFDNRAAIGGFSDGGLYWSATSCQHPWSDYAWVQRFAEGDGMGFPKTCELAVRLVRS